jgi:medium-chain acyl-[acyl-carrier-protein] hydrolase
MRHVEYTTPNRWIVASGAKPEAVARLFCFSHAGAGVAAYRGWAEAASSRLEVCTIQLPGRENRLRETPSTSLEELASALADAIHSMSERPFAVFGHSLGGIIAFETIRQLRRSGGAIPTALFVSASRAPQFPWPHSPVRHLGDLELLTEVHRRYGSVPEVILEDAELRQLLTPALRADMTVMETYRHEAEAPFGFPIVAFGGDEDRMVGRPDLEGWSEQTSGAFRLRMLAGDHLFLQTRRRELLDEIEGTLGLSHSQRLTASSR